MLNFLLKLFQQKTGVEFLFVMLVMFKLFLLLFNEKKYPPCWVQGKYKGMPLKTSLHWMSFCFYFWSCCKVNLSSWGWPKHWCSSHHLVTESLAAESNAFGQQTCLFAWWNGSICSKQSQAANRICIFRAGVHHEQACVRNEAWLCLAQGSSLKAVKNH